MKERDPFFILSQIKTVFNKEDLELFAIISWHIWFDRNKEIIGDIRPRPSEMVEWCYRYWESFCVPKLGRPGICANRGSTRWVAPPVGMMKVNVDAGCRRDRET